MHKSDVKFVNVGVNAIDNLFAEIHDSLDPFLKLINRDEAVVVGIQFVHKLVVGHILQQHVDPQVPQRLVHLLLAQRLRGEEYDAVVAALNVICSVEELTVILLAYEVVLVNIDKSDEFLEFGLVDSVLPSSYQKVVKWADFDFAEQDIRFVELFQQFLETGSDYFQEISQISYIVQLAQIGFVPAPFNALQKHVVVDHVLPSFWNQADELLNLGHI